MIARALSGPARAARALLALGAAASCDGGGSGPSPAPAAAPGPPWLADATGEAGVEFAHVAFFERRFWFPEIMGSGLAWFDHDGDGRVDLFCVQGGDVQPGDRELPTARLFRGLPDGRFEDVTERAGVGQRAVGMGCTAGDYDGDGDVDLYLTNVGPNRLYRNQGDGTFRDVTQEMGVGDAGWGTSTGFFDFDRDGDLDLLVVNYVRWSPERELPCRSSFGERDYCAPTNYNAPSQCVLYRNDGDRFRDVTADAGLATIFGNGLGLALSDFDGDGWLDVYVSNDGMPNQLWINQKDGRFVDRAVAFGAAVNRNGMSEASMGTVPADVDQDGDPDLFITNLRGETNTLYVNDGRGRMTDATSRTGLTMASLQFTGFGDGFADFDHDGQLDLYIANGRVGYWEPKFSETDPYAEPNQLFRGLGGLRFEEVSPQGGLARNPVGNSRGLAIADWDEDGDADLAVLENHGPLRLLRNVAAKRGGWIGLALRLPSGAHDLGARARIAAGGRVFWREATACASYCSANDPRLLCGLGSAERVDEVVVAWTDGTREAFGPFAAGAKHDLVRGTGRAPSGGSAR